MAKEGRDQKKQHFVPRCYLQAWCDPDCAPGHEPYTWTFARDGSDLRRKAPENLFYEKDMYTVRVPNGSRDLRLERSLGGFEGSFVDVRDRLVRERRQLPLIAKIKLVAFLAAMHGRTPGARERTRLMWQPVLNLMDEMQAGIAQMNAEERARLPRSIASRSTESSMSREDVVELVEQPLQAMVGPHIQAVTHAIFEREMSLSIMCTEDDMGFITSDDPCVWHDPLAYRRPPAHRQVALMYKSVEITLPIDPHHLLFVSYHRDLPPYVDVGAHEVAEYNRRTRFFAHERCVTRRPAVDPYWLDPGVPEDEHSASRDEVSSPPEGGG